MADVRIMVVEDENIVARDIQNRLQHFGYVVAAAASSGEEAVEKAAEAQPDLVLMDIMLKGDMDGTEAADQLRTRFNIPVVYLTAYADEHTLRRAKITGPFGYILKPFEESELRTTIEMALFKHQAEEALRKARDELELRVEERTADLKSANERLKQEVEEHRQTTEALRESEAELLQAQKMEAVGRLAGGVAHDFNNNLGVIRGYLDMVLDQVPRDTSLHDYLLQALEATTHSSALSRQLLVFGSQQPMDKLPMDLNRQVGNLEKMLGRLLGEDVVVDLRLLENLWTVKADSVNLDQVVINLAVNARDAMPEGGTLRIETENVVVDEAYCQRHPEGRPGRFVRLVASDTGVGMDPEVVARLFEPFFTTKASDKGTGLGLSVVYGIVQSHEGWITIQSEPGKGSRFEIYLPALIEEAYPVPEVAPPVSLDRPRGQGERILLVEDEDTLREMLETMLEDKEYNVHACGTVAEARAVLQNGHGPFDLILCDVVLPDGHGPDLVTQALEAHADLAAVLMTGYLDERGRWERVREAGLVVLHKPIAMADLLAQVGGALKKRHTS